MCVIWRVDYIYERYRAVYRYYYTISRRLFLLLLLYMIDYYCVLLPYYSRRLLIKLSAPLLTNPSLCHPLPRMPQTVHKKLWRNSTLLFFSFFFSISCCSTGIGKNEQKLIFCTTPGVNNEVRSISFVFSGTVGNSSGMEPAANNIMKKSHESFSFSLWPPP